MSRPSASAVHLSADPDDPGGAGDLLDAAGAESFFAGRAWYRTVRAHALPEGETASFATIADACGRPSGVFPLRRCQDGTLAGLTTPYTCRFAPAFRPGLDRAGMARASQAFGALCRGEPVVRLDALPAEWPGLPALLEGVRAAGLAVRRFEHFGNWTERVDGLSWDDYLARRPGALRETVRRKCARLARTAHAEVSVIADGAALESGIAAFDAVYGRSWKEPEPFPAFNAALMRAAAPLGKLRLGVLRVDGAPAAAQFWIVEGRRATVLKLAHDEAFRQVSPGTVLTATMVRRLIEQERVAEIDFGRGDDPYKQDWASARRQRIGLLLINPRRAAGMALLARQAIGDARRGLRRPAPA